MSGFAVVYNQQNTLALEKMFKCIGHRGPYLSAKFKGCPLILKRRLKMKS